jgi:uncharacterized protein (TIGR02594 family)
MPNIKTVWPTDPEHLKRAFADLGLSEIQGSRHEPRVIKMYALSGNPGIKNDETAWCAAAVGAWLKEAGLPNTGSLMARSYARYGKDVAHLPLIPRGAICVWPRGAPPSGHVNICLEDDGVYLTCIGGNQGNGAGGGVTISRERKSKLVAARLPATKAAPVPIPKPAPKRHVEVEEPDPDVPVRKPQPDETAVVPVDAPAAEQEKQIQDSAERDAEPRGSWIARKWKALTGWFSGAAGLGGLSLYDPWVVVAIGGVALVVIVAFVWFMGPGEVRAWVRKQVT